ncbi:hypothetical protein [Euzebya rosea]|uniref:hypothetical protein n=1 Tax=Euzebya rosea TaxID=2052804 RepID=UPI000D3E5524|nr:hypothetical protein [Euzebya rosea]
MADQLAWPMRLDHTGRIATVDRDSIPGTAQAVRLTVVTDPGERTVSPTFGTPDPTYSGLDETELRSRIRRWVPRALLDVTVGQADGHGIQPVRIVVTGVR